MHRIVAVILATLALLLLATYPNYAEESDGGIQRRRLPGRFISQIALAIIFVSAIFVLVSVLWQHTASVAGATIAANVGNGVLKSGVGVTAMVLGWFSFALLIIVVIGLLVMYVSPSLGVVGRRWVANIITPGFSLYVSSKSSTTSATTIEQSFSNLLHFLLKISHHVSFGISVLYI